MMRVRTYGLFAIVLAAVVVAFAFSAPPAFAQERALKLFTPASGAADGGSIAAASKPVPGAARQRLVGLDLQSLEKGIAPRGLDRAEDRLQRSPRNPPPLNLELFPGKAGTFRKQDLQKAPGGGYIWTGEQVGKGGAATLVVNGDRITGHVELDGAIFKIEPAGSNVHRIIELNPRALPEDGPHLKPQSSSATPRSAPDSQTSGSSVESEPTIANATTGITTVNLLVAYTSAAATASSDILADINLAASLTNRAYYNSGANVRVRLAGTILVADYDESRYEYSTTLANLTGIADYKSTFAGRASFTPTRQMRNTVKADLVTLVRDGGEYCGQGWLIDAPSSRTAGYGFSQLSLGCISIYVMAHELGHNMGVAHDRYVEPAAPASEYNFGFVNVSKRVRDIMSYSSRCDAAGVSCAMKNMFSNPRKLVNDARFGIFVGQPGAANATYRLNQTRQGVASYR